MDPLLKAGFNMEHDEAITMPYSEESELERSPQKLGGIQRDPTTILTLAVSKFNEGKRADGLDLLANGLDNALLDGHMDVARAILVGAIECKLPLSARILLLALARPWRSNELETEWNNLFDNSISLSKSERSHVLSSAEAILGGLR